jgi:hypothetical protein
VATFLEKPAARLRERVDVVGERLTDHPFAMHAVAMCRILLGLAVLGLLATNYSTRQMWVGDGSVWAEASRAANSFPEVDVLDGMSGDLLSLLYVALALSSAALVLGWHTRVMSILTLLGFIGVVGQNPVVSSAGDSLIRLGLLWLVLMAAGDRWSLDQRAHVRHEARRRDDVRVLPPWLRTGLHNVAFLGLTLQVALVYLAAGLDKVASGAWQDGTALYTTLQLPEFRPFPWLSDLLSDGRVPLAIVTYAVLFTQLFFVPLLLHPVTRRIVVVMAIVLNVVFAVVLATPWTSLAVIAVTALFGRDEDWESLGLRIGDRAAPVLDWIFERWYDLLDRVEDWWFSAVLPVIDRVWDAIRRR